MQYISTRGQAPTIGFCDVLLAGLARDGGLYVPETWPKLIGLTGGASVASTKNSAAVSYAQRAAQIMSPFVGDEIDRQVFERL
ncbi:MAG: threonine synthase, partial [Acidimicrobiia bacterium]|nr:threonine synthase [Acidimicrobiia bacterium]